MELKSKLILYLKKFMQDATRMYNKGITKFPLNQPGEAFDEIRSEIIGCIFAEGEPSQLYYLCRQDIPVSLEDGVYYISGVQEVRNFVVAAKDRYGLGK